MLTTGPEFGDPSVDTESIFARLSRFSPSPKGPKRTSLVADYGNPRSWYGAKATAVAPCTNDDEVTDAVVSGVAKHDYTFARLTELSQVQNCKRLFLDIADEFRELTEGRERLQRR